MSSRQLTGGNYSLYFLDLDGTITDKLIQTQANDILTMRLSQLPNDAETYELPPGDSMICDLKIEAR